MPVPQLQELIDSRHFNELIAYDRIHNPFNMRFEFYLAQLSMIIANSNLPKNHTPYKLSDFLYNKPKPVVWSDEMMFHAMAGIARAMGQTDIPEYHNADHREAQHHAHG